MPRIKKCYFGCATKGPFHRYPKPDYPNQEKFKQWKMVLNEDLRAKGDTYIYNKILLCDCHFEEFYRSPSKRLTRNAVPTLNLRNVNREQIITSQDDIILSINTSKSVHPSEPLSVTTQQMDVLTVPFTSQKLPSSEPLITIMDLEQMNVVTVPSTSKMLNTSGPKRCPKQKTLVCNKAENDVRKLKQEIIRLKRRCHYYKLRWEYAEKFNKSLSLGNVNIQMILPTITKYS